MVWKRENIAHRTEKRREKSWLPGESSPHVLCFALGQGTYLIYLSNLTVIMSPRIHINEDTQFSYSLSLGFTQVKLFRQTFLLGKDLQQLSFCTARTMVRNVVVRLSSSPSCFLPSVWLVRAGPECEGGGQDGAGSHDQPADVHTPAAPEG